MQLQLIFTTSHGLTLLTKEQKPSTELSHHYAHHTTPSPNPAALTHHHRIHRHHAAPAHARPASPGPCARPPAPLPLAPHRAPARSALVLFPLRRAAPRPAARPPAGGSLHPGHARLGARRAAPLPGGPVSAPARRRRAAAGAAPRRRAGAAHAVAARARRGELAGDARAWCADARERGELLCGRGDEVHSDGKDSRYSGE
ncbi:hypothetical protein BBAD15_g11034 [Beauveria bassiana D1-5]|uniref:Uncharacterized protein n=1 Tax=Beauveria bassiana D1-5 TaxID=1245745 RepID=A0A0A2V8C7_BEABA|nr:hypothetical protein BBAD15_g11034 [Beauveria bassiana D1-5]